MMRAQREGTFAFRGYDVWYKIVGEREQSGRLPLLIAHGGPGATHQYLSSLGDLGDHGRRVIFYDQLGCGNSAHPTDPDLFTPELFVEELGALRAALDLTEVHLLGQSWGGMLAMQYALTQPRGLASIIVADSPADMTQWVSEANRLREALPPDVARALVEHEAAGTTTDPAYLAAVDVFYRRHVCRLDPWPPEVLATVHALEHDGFVYNVMNGPSEFHVIGKLKTWSLLDRLGEIRVPTLLLSGAFDEATPPIVSAIRDRIAHAEWVLFPASSHMPHVEEPVAFRAAVRGFLSGIEQAR